MKTLISLMLILSSTLASYAADTDMAAKQKERFAKAKSMAEANIDKRISALQQTKSCISGANDKNALRKCRQEAKQRNQALRQEMQQMKGQFGRGRGGRGQGQGQGQGRAQQ